ncbi:TIGR01619 family protein [Seminibacterium arietis]|uniref:TIGR01619 family protein n=1 Tax=Seminibacterium arietis TaxID=1173502 RepID=A0ABW3I7W3_9PAST
MEQKEKGDWQIYRTLVNGKPAICSVNLSLFEQQLFSENIYDNVLEVVLAYQADKDGLPDSAAYQALLTEIMRISTLLCSQPNVFYAGYVLSSSEAKLHFYCKSAVLLMDILHQFPSVKHSHVQYDPAWDIYFDFLLPSSLEIKINATEEILDILLQNGYNLAELYFIEHTFHFLKEEQMYQFLEQVSVSDMPILTLKHTNTPVQLDENDNVYLVKIDQELQLNNSDIFDYVEQLENFALHNDGDYIGWESPDIILSKNQLN